MKVFLSSTYVDLRDHRQKAAEAIERLGPQLGRMEIFGARPEEAQEASLREIEACDILVGIYAHRYGYLPAGSDISITEAEFRHAKGLGKPIFCFVIDENHPWPPGMVEEEPGKTKLRAFKTEISTSLVREAFTTPDDLAVKVATSLGRYMAQPFDPLVDGLRSLIARGSNASASNRQAIATALSAAVEIANRTLRYLAQQQRSQQRDTNEETELARGWENAGSKLLDLPSPETDLANRYFLKAEYWSYPEIWSDEHVDAARIRLKDISRESREVLLRMQLPDN